MFFVFKFYWWFVSIQLNEKSSISWTLFKKELLIRREKDFTDKKKSFNKKKKQLKTYWNERSKVNKREYNRTNTLAWVVIRCSFGQFDFLIHLFSIIYGQIGAHSINIIAKERIKFALHRWYIVLITHASIGTSHSLNRLFNI